MTVWVYNVIWVSSSIKDNSTVLQTVSQPQAVRQSYKSQEILKNFLEEKKIRLINK